MSVFVILLVLCSLVIQFGSHWSQLQVTYLLTYFYLLMIANFRQLFAEVHTPMRAFCFVNITLTL